MEISREFNTFSIISEMVENLRLLEEADRSGRTSVGLSIKTQWQTPSALLPLAVYSSVNGIKIDPLNSSPSIQDYLQVIHFPAGTTASPQKGGTYLPLTQLTAVGDDSILEAYEDAILDEMTSGRGVAGLRNAVKYLTSELVTNIREHAVTERYWILSQYWKKTNICEIAIADRGRGYLESYRGTAFEAKNHRDALWNAVNGNSSKNDVERGAGIPGSIKLLTEGYRGEFAIMSGDALYIAGSGSANYYELPVNWRGAFVMLRFTPKALDYISYLT